MLYLVYMFTYTHKTSTYKTKATCCIRNKRTKNATEKNNCNGNQASIPLKACGCKKADKPTTIQ